MVLKYKSTNMKIQFYNIAILDNQREIKIILNLLCLQPLKKIYLKCLTYMKICSYIILK